jgi:nucleotide-binding universal stress UspA family protein
MKKILVPTDFGIFSKEAIKYAALLASGFNAELILFHAYHIEDKNILATEKINGEHIPGYTQWEAQIQLNEICDQVRNSHNNVGFVQPVLKNGFVFEELIRYVKSENIDFIVMSTGGASGFSRLLGGTVTSDVVSTLDCPVLVIPPGYTFDVPKEIIYATDLSQEDPELVALIVQISALFKSHLALLNIITNEPLSFKEKNIHVLEEHPEFKNYRNRSYHLLDAENTVEGIQDFAKFRKAGMVIMASNKRNLFQKIFSHSLTKEMAQITRLPLLALHKSGVVVKS